jgi:hypothetical protein
MLRNFPQFATAKNPNCVCRALFAREVGILNSSVPSVVKVSCAQREI